MTTPQPDEIYPATRAVFASYLAMRSAGQATDFEELCAAHPELQDQLKALHHDWTAAAGTQADAAAGPDGAVLPSLSGSRRYKLCGEVARGGMGAILKVWDRDLQRNLAMKVILLEEDTWIDGQDTPADPVVFNRFLEEAQITGQLDHPGVVPVHELGMNERGQVFFTMRLVKGQDFEQIIGLARANEQGWTKQRALATLLKVCETMAYAHAKRVVHRDLKPANVMVGQFGETYVMDWGLARVLDNTSTTHSRPSSPAVSLTKIRTTGREESKSGTAELTQEGSVIGTPCYMAPEQAFGKLDEIGPSSDVYAVGSMLYQLLTGFKPYTDDDRMVGASAVLGRLRAGPPTPVHKLAPDVPVELAAICEKAMSRAQAERYPTMIEMAEDLRAYMEHRVVRAHETGAVAEFKKWVVRNKGMAASVAGLILLALASLVTVVLLERGKTRAIESEQANTRAALDEAREQTYVANVRAADLSLQANDHGETRRALDASPVALRGWEWHYLRFLADTSRATLDGHDGRVTAVAVDSNGGLLATSDEGHKIHLWDAENGSHVKTLEGHKDRVLALAFTGQGDRLISVGDDPVIRIWNVRLGGEATSVPMESRAVGAVAVAADSDLVAVATRKPAVVLLELKTGRKEELPADHGRILSLALAGERVFAGFDDGRILAWTRGSEESTTLHRSKNGGLHALAYEAGSTELAAGAENGTVVQLDAVSGSVTREFVAHSEMVLALSYDRQGHHLATASFDKRARIWDSSDGGLIEELNGHALPVRAIALSPDGDTVITGSDDGDARLWRVGANKPFTTWSTGTEEEGSYSCLAVNRASDLLLVGFIGTARVHVAALPSGRVVSEVFAGEEGEDANTVTFSPDGALVAAAFEGAVRIWNPATGKQVAPDLSHLESVRSIAFDPDGARLYSASADGNVRAWGVPGGESLGVVYHSAEPLETIAITRAGDRIAVGCVDGTVALVDPISASAPQTWRASETTVKTVAFDPDGTRLATAGSDRRIRIWTIDGGSVGTQPLMLEGHDHFVESIAFNEEGTRLVSGSLDHTVRIWDAASGRALLTLRDGDELVQQVLFTPDGQRIVSMSRENIRIRDLGRSR